jgi:iron complex transport system ATP-binding protein
MHDLTPAVRFADRILVIREGRLVVDGVPRDVLTPAQLAATFGIEATLTDHDGAVLLTPWRALT